MQQIALVQAEGELYSGANWQQVDSWNDSYFPGSEPEEEGGAEEAEPWRGKKGKALVSALVASRAPPPEGEGPIHLHVLGEEAEGGTPRKVTVSCITMVPAPGGTTSLRVAGGPHPVAKGRPARILREWDDTETAVTEEQE
mmetsp:Transcript_32878/g.73664  ORF Transcript_32878/g.73664 Transcript_32878/m.73664 type:complete len:141 (+) Transcript_32878:414-836(+)